MSEEPCQHRRLFGNICIDCNKIIYGAQSRSIDDPLAPLTEEQGISDNKTVEKNMLEMKKLALVIDLDKTLIDTLVIRNREEGLEVIKKSGVDPSEFLIFSLNQMFLIRYRPHVREFLAAIAPLYRLQLYTLAEKGYAKRILKVIDPNNEYFHQRIYTRVDGDDGTKVAKNIKRIFPYSDKLVLVLDDNPDVWREEDGFVFKGLVQLEPFSYFESPKLPTNFFQTANSDTTLLEMQRVLEEVHRRFYDDFDPEESHVLITLADVKMSLYQGLCFIFVGCWENGDDKTMDIYHRKAEEFGALVVTEFVPYVTHVIIGQLGPGPACDEAIKYNGIHIVQRSWFILTHLNYKLFPEEEYGVGGYPITTDGDLEREDLPTTEEIDIDDMFLSEGENEGENSKPEKVTYDELANDPNWLSKLDDIPSDAEEDNEEEDHVADKE